MPGRCFTARPRPWRFRFNAARATILKAYRHVVWLPKGSAAKPRASHVSPYTGGDARHWRVTFADHHAEYQSSRHFPAKVEADDYASDFLVRLREEINRP